MPLAARIIPVLLHDRFTLVKGRRFQWHRPIGHVAQAAKIYGARGVDELMVLDVAATARGTGPDLPLIEQITAPQFTPVTVGGGIRDAKDVDALLKAGADKILIRTAWRKNRQFVREMADRYGSQAIVVAVDYSPNLHSFASTVAAVRQAQHDGAGEVVLTNMELEGMGTGYDLQMIAAATREIDIPLVAHGGAGTYRHMAEAIVAGASAVAAGSMFAFEDLTPKGAAEYLQNEGIEARV